MILSSFSVTVSFASVIVLPTTSLTFPNVSEATSAIFPNASFTVVHNLFTAFRNVSEWLYSATNPATRPAIARTTIAMGFADIAALSSHCPAAAAFAATVWAIVAAVPAVVAVVFAVDATVDAVSAAVSVTVAAVFPASFAIILGMMSRMVLYVSTAFFIPCPNFPTAMVAGAIAATNRPTLMIVCCCPSSSVPNHSHKVPTFSVNPSIIGVADVKIV